jgi:hypothetical protein
MIGFSIRNSVSVSYDFSLDTSRQFAKLEVEISNQHHFNSPTKVPALKISELLRYFFSLNKNSMRFGGAVRTNSPLRGRKPISPRKTLQQISKNHS